MNVVLQLLNTSTTLGTFIVGILSSLVAGIILGFFTGKNYQKKSVNKTNQNGNGNVNVIDSHINGSPHK